MPGRERAEICLENYYRSAGERNTYLDLGQTADTDTTQTDCQQSGNSSVFYDNWRKEIKIEIMIKESIYLIDPTVFKFHSLIDPARQIEN